MINLYRKLSFVRAIYKRQNLNVWLGQTSFFFKFFILKFKNSPLHNPELFHSFHESIKSVADDDTKIITLMKTSNKNATFFVSVTARNRHYSCLNWNIGTTARLPRVPPKLKSYGSEESETIKKSEHEETKEPQNANWTAELIPTNSLHGAWQLL